MAVNMKRSRQSTTALVKEVCPRLYSHLSFSIEIYCAAQFLISWFCCVVDGEITTAYVNNFCASCILSRHISLHTLYLISSLLHLHSYSGGMTRPQSPICCCCQRSIGANLSACALNQQSVRTPALHCTRDYRSDSGPQLPKCIVLLLGCRLLLQLHVLVQSLWLHPVPYIRTVSPLPSVFIFSISCFLSRFQTRDALHFSEDEDAVIVGSLDYYIDDCPWVSGTQYTPQRVTGPPDGTANIKDTVCDAVCMCLQIWIKNLVFRLARADVPPGILPSREIYSYLLFVFLKRLPSPSVEKRYAYSPTPERGRTTTPHHQERRERVQGQTSENKENIAVQEKDVEIFALPPPRTPASSKKNTRPNKNVLSTPNQNANVNGAKTNAVTPKGGGSASKENNKKRGAEVKELASTELLAFSPERRWVACRMAGGSEVKEY